MLLVIIFSIKSLSVSLLNVSNNNNNTCPYGAKRRSYNNF